MWKSTWKAAKSRIVVGAHFADEFLGGDAFFFGAEHDGRAVGVVGADMPAFGSAHAVESGPDVGLDVAEEMAEVNVAVGVWQGGGHQDATGGGGWGAVGGVVVMAGELY